MGRQSSIFTKTKHLTSRPLHVYADWRVGATVAEKHCYKKSDSVLLTFDDYGTPEEVHDILAILHDAQVKAMFFLQGDWAAEYPELVGEIQRAGHVVGNHTYSHPVLRGLSETQVIQEIKTGLPGPWLRPPEGRYDKRVRHLAAGLGYHICYWTIDSRDWTGASASAMRHTILSELHPAAVILFHLHGKHTRELLPGLIQDIRARGYELTSMSETWSPN
ncbi:MAG TPA: polysaccharide deacetylase family protein [Candidatus Saccharimonadales bacterium]|nr:polysaccharide deacetylase family protein [Candidatus Saccharimonadales bacterium]